MNRYMQELKESLKVISAPSAAIKMVTCKVPVGLKNKFLMIYFRNDVFCRRESNQHSARKLWQEIKCKIPAKVASKFEIEWNHYCLSHIDRESFAEDVDMAGKALNNGSVPPEIQK